MVDVFFFFFQAEDGIRDIGVTGVQTCALPIYPGRGGGQGRDPPDQGVRLIDAVAPGPGDVVDRVFREEHGRAIATLIRVLGDFDLAEEAVADAYVTALERWPADGIPTNPGAWITTTARNRAIDRIRRNRRFAEKAPVLFRDAAFDEAAREEALLAAAEDDMTP